MFAHLVNGKSILILLESCNLQNFSTSYIICQGVDIISQMNRQLLLIYNDIYLFSPVFYYREKDGNSKSIVEVHGDSLSILNAKVGVDLIILGVVYVLHIVNAVWLCQNGICLKVSCIIWCNTDTFIFPTEVKPVPP